MGRRSTRRQRTRQSRSAHRSTNEMTWAKGLVVVILVLAAGGIFYANSKGSEQDLLSSSTAREVGKKIGDQIPEFNLRLVNGTTVNSAELVNTKKPAFYFFFATW